MHLLQAWGSRYKTGRLGPRCVILYSKLWQFSDIFHLSWVGRGLLHFSPWRKFSPRRPIHSCLLLYHHMPQQKSEERKAQRSSNMTREGNVNKRNRNPCYHQGNEEGNRSSVMARGRPGEGHHSHPLLWL